jgi:hypothetical protein
MKNNLFLILIAFGMLLLLSCSGKTLIINPTDSVVNKIPAGQYPDAATVNGKYYELIMIVNCPQDSGQYGEFCDYGYWSGNTWCGQAVKSGFWVWVPPNWYVWQYKK